jgi:brefeldin A-resistance guanine nucleotide exchange factor 1
MSEADEVACQDALDKREIWPKSIVFKPPHGVICMQKILVLLCQLTDPSKKDERSRVLGLSLLNVVLETCGSSLSNHTLLVNVMQNTLCKFLLQNSRTTSLSILSLVLRAVFNMFNSVGVHLKVQLEVFFNSMHLALAESTSSSPLIREMALESLIEFCREPQLIIDLYVNYDCAVQSTNLFERLVKFLFKMSEPGASLNSFHLQAFEGILAILGALCKEIDRQHTHSCIFNEAGTDAVASSSVEATDAIRDSRIRKKSLQVAAEAFNKNPKESVRNLQSYGFAVLPEPSPHEVAAFLRQAPGLNKTVVGEYLGDHHAFNVDVLKAYASTFSFHNMSLDAALRLFLSGFRLCGEAQKIDRVMEAFSKTMHEHSPGPLKKWDGAFTLAFSLIMLNTDIHSPNVKNKMTKEQFIRNNKGMNAGEDFPRE